MRDLIRLAFVLGALLLAFVGYAPIASAATQTHVVQPGETLSVIAERYGVSTAELATANGIYNTNLIYAGQTLIVPQPSDATVSSDDGARESLEEESVAQDEATPDEAPPDEAPPDEAPPDEATPGEAGQDDAAAETALPATHIVQPGETLGKIAELYDLTLAQMAAANGIANYNVIYVGQELTIPDGSEVVAEPYSPLPVTAHVVREGETLRSIAALYGLTYTQLMLYNDISDPSWTYTGQVLEIPQIETLLDPYAIPASAADKYIVVDKSEQRAYLFENDEQIDTFIVSTGMAGSATAAGVFSILNKIPNAYAATWDLEMPYWLGIYWSGSLQNGFHALPIMSDGTVLWEGLLGSPASFGCIILSTGDAAQLYEWADIGTVVEIRP